MRFVLGLGQVGLGVGDFDGGVVFWVFGGFGWGLVVGFWYWWGGLGYYWGYYLIGLGGYFFRVFLNR